MFIKEAIQNIREKKLDLMKENLEKTIVSKAVAMLEEKKVNIAKAYFGKGEKPETKAKD